MAVDRAILENIAADRRARMLPDGSFRFDLTPERIERSAQIAMELAGASRPQVEARLEAEENPSRH
jgi:hypothetical protein